MNKKVRINEHFQCEKRGRAVTIARDFIVLEAQGVEIDRALARVSCNCEGDCGTWPGQQACSLPEKAPMHP
jgi:hypothetical protein